MGEMVWINGRMHGREEAVISVFDHGFLFGDSIYETVRTSRGRPFLLERHLPRLHRSAASLSLDLDPDDDFYRAAVSETLAAAGNPESAIRIVVTRGIGDIGYDRNLCPSRTTLIYVRPMNSIRDPVRRRGIHAAFVDIRRNDRSAVSPAIKSGNLLNNLLGSFEAQEKGADEGIMLNRDGYVAEGTMTNFFVVRQGNVQTPALESGILPGITRAFVLELAAEAGIPVAESLLRPDELLAADEVFLTGTTRGILPVTTVDGNAVGDGHAGPLTRRLMQIFDDAEDRLQAAVAGE